VPIIDTPMTIGRGRGKISPEALVAEFWNNLERDRAEIKIGKTKLLSIPNQIIPRLTEQFVSSGL
jgi:uncharacterized oxidoreductase